MLNAELTVTVLGAGHGALALAGYLAQNGHRVTLWNRSPQRIAAVAAAGGIRLGRSGARPAFAPLAGTTSDIRAAVASAKRIVVALPASAHADVARACAPHLRDGQTVLLVPGRTGGALEFRRVLREAGCSARVLLGEANTFPFAARCVGPADAHIYGTKSEVLAAALPASGTGELVDRWAPLLPMLAPASNVLQTGLGNLGAILHPVITLLNAGRITSGSPFDFYTDGVTPTVAAALAIADEERLRVADAYDVPAESLIEWVASAYGHRADTVLEAVGGNPSYRGITAPNTLVHRYLLEDVPTGLIPLIGLAGAAGEPVPMLRRLVSLARAALGRQAWLQARTLAGLGLAGMGIEQIRALVGHGLGALPCSVKRGGSVALSGLAAGCEWSASAVG